VSETIRPAGPGTDDWDGHWSDFGDPALNNPANDYRNQLVLHHLGHPDPGSTILDIGSGQGQLALYLKKRFPESHVLGIEYSAEGVRRARQSAREAGLDARFVQRDLLRAPEGENAPSALPKGAQAVCSEVLEHVDQPEVLLRNAAEYLLPGCRLVITVPGGPMSALDHHIGHRRHYSPASLRALLEASGFRVETILRAGFPFFDLYRLAVIVRGRRLIDDLTAASDDHGGSTLQRWASRLFRASFRLNLGDTPFGWQIVAVARSCSA
jgi:SAM-dependent methyltransferase